MCIRDSLCTALADVAPWLELSTAQAGLHLAAQISGAFKENDVVGAAMQADVGLTGFGPMWLGQPTSEGLIIGYSRPAEHQFSLALERLSELLGSIG